MLSSSEVLPTFIPIPYMVVQYSYYSLVLAYV